MLVFSIVNFFILLGIFFTDIKNKYFKHIGKKIIIIIFFTMAGLNYKVHNDFFGYEIIYGLVTSENFQNINYEKGYVFLNLIFNNILNFYQFKMLIYLINTFLIYKGIKRINSKEVPLILALLYFYMNFYATYLSAFRQSIAMSLFIL